MDRISGLPNEIVSHIVSFVSAKEAAFISVLSKRFQNLYNIIQVLEFDNTGSNRGRLTDFLDGVLALPPSSRIRKFSLKSCWAVRPAHYAHLNRCLGDVLKRGVLELKLNIHVEKGYSLPSEVFTCKTIVKLKLGRKLDIDFVPENAFLPALKTLVLRSVRFYNCCGPCGCSFQKLLSSCPVLEELIIHGVNWEQWKWSRTVSSPTLQRLTIRRDDYIHFDGAGFGSITFDTPGLTYLDYNDFLPQELPTVNLYSLDVAHLQVRTVDHAGQQDVVVEDDPIISDPTNLIMGLRNVRILMLLSTDTTEMFHLFHEAIPVFENLKRLSFYINDEFHCWSFLPLLLKKTPNLKNLIIEGPLHHTQSDEQEPDYVCKCVSGYSWLWTCPVEVLEIFTYKGEIYELEQLKHFLGKLSCLKLLIIIARARTDEEKLQITTDVLMIPKASVNCKIQIYFVKN